MNPRARILSTVVTAAFCGISLGAQAAPVFIANPGFEAQEHGPNTFTFGAPTDWEGLNTGAVDGETIGALNPSGTTYFGVGNMVEPT